jgi:hypothetical protein
MIVECQGHVPELDSWHFRLAGGRDQRPGVS